MINSFIIEIENGKVGFKSDHHKKLFDNYVAQFRDGKYRLEINELKEKRSDKQHRYYWVYLGIISRESGHTPEELHLLFKGLFLTKDIKEIMGKQVRITKSTTELSKGEFCEYLVQISGECGVELPATNDYLGYSYHEAHYHK